MRVMVRSHAASNCVVSRGRRKARDESVGAAEVLMTSAIADISDRIAGLDFKTVSINTCGGEARITLIRVKPR